jgi:hypothetical protein
MRVVNFNNKTFALLENLVTADYYGGTVRYGKIIARLDGEELHMRYHCLTTEDVLKSGKAIAKVILNEEQKILLHLDWEWLDGGGEKATSVYIEMG